MKTVQMLIIALVAVFTAVTAHAQTQVGSWVAGVDFGPASMIHIDGADQPFGALHSSPNSPDKPLLVNETKNPFAKVFIEHLPLGHWGFGASAKFFGTKGQLVGTADENPPTGQQAIIWGVDVTPKIVTTAGFTQSLRNYSSTTSFNFSKVDFVVNRSWGSGPAWASLFGGAALLNIKGSETISQDQTFLLFTKNPNGTLGAQGDRERYGFQSVSSVSYRGVGLTGGIKGAFCIGGGLYLDGQVAYSVFPSQKANLTGQFTATKDIDLVNVAGGVNSTAPPLQNLARLNWAPDAKHYDASVGGTVPPSKRVSVYDTTSSSAATC